MLGEPLDLLVQPIGIEPFEPCDDAGMEGSPPLLEQAAVGHLVSQGMLEGVDTFGEEVRLIEELGGLEVREATVQCLLGHLGNCLQQRQGHLCTDDRSCSAGAVFLPSAAGLCVLRARLAP